MKAHANLPKLAIASLGGTVSMRASASEWGVMPKLDCDEQLAELPQLREMAQLEAATLGLLPSASLGFARCSRCWPGPGARWLAEHTR